MERKHILFILSLLLVLLSSCNNPARINNEARINNLTESESSDIPHIDLSTDNAQVISELAFYNFCVPDTFAIGEIKMFKSPSYLGRIGEVDSIQFYHVFFEKNGEILQVDSILGFGKPSVSADTRKILIPTIRYQYEDFTFGGDLLLIDFTKHRIDRVSKLYNSCAACVSDNICTYINNANMFAYDISSGVNRLIAILTDTSSEVSNIACFYLNKNSDRTYTIQFFSDITNDVLNGKHGRKIQCIIPEKDSLWL